MFTSPSMAEAKFQNSGPFFHVHTEPIESDLLIRNESDAVTLNNLLAVATLLSGSRLLAFALMSNHIHLIIEGGPDVCEACFEGFKTQLLNHRSRHGGSSAIKKMKAGYTSINSLRQLRDEIAYVIRNPFVVSEDVNPLAYRWCSGYLYFNPLLNTRGVQLADLPVRTRRAILHSRNLPPDNAAILTGLIANGSEVNPCSFVDYLRAMEYFDDARNFVMCVFRNIEGQVETARRLGEQPRLNDTEALSLTLKLCRGLFAVNSLRDLTFSQRQQLALKLKNEYSSSNGQIARCTRLSLSDVNMMFPLAAKQAKR